MKNEVTFLVSGLALFLGACGSDHGGLTAPNDTTGASTTGTSATTVGSSGSTVGSGGGGTSGSDTTATTGAGGTTDVGTGGAGTGGAGTGGGTGGGSSDDAGMPIASCVFHTDPPRDGGTQLYSLIDDDAGDGAINAGDSAINDATTSNDAAPSSDASSSNDGAPRTEGGASDGGSRSDARADAGPATSITVLTSPFLGAYLADSAGRVLYTYGGDMPGDCQYPPVSGCEADCIIAWPVFDAGARTLPASLDDKLFGTIVRKDNALQTTYYGWPLYYFKTDLAPGMLGGQAKAKTWHAATVIPAGVVIMKGVTFAKYLGDGGGRTLYAFDQDTKGTSSSDPISACTGDCLALHPPFWRNRLSVVSSLEPTDFSVFTTSHGPQLAFRGAPLYYSAADARSGDTKEAAMGWSVLVP